GHTVGGGLEIALACDLRVGRAGDFVVGLPEVNLGVLPGTGGTQRLARLVGKGRAMELMCEGENVSFERAVELGIINKTWEAESHAAFMKKILDYALEFTAPHKAVLAIGNIKRAVQSGVEMSLAQGLAFERELQSQLFSSQDAKEGLNAYIAKRPPQFKGK
ncbi:MAG: enoyl-CoA hydratase/isomerase family protein, partial [Polyangiaceae bacterium]